MHITLKVSWKQGKILFGILLRYEIDDGVEQEPESLLQVGQEIHANSF